jgi:hypothetical protein
MRGLRAFPEIAFSGNLSNWMFPVTSLKNISHIFGESGLMQMGAGK